MTKQARRLAICLVVVWLALDGLAVPLSGQEPGPTEMPARPGPAEGMRPAPVAAAGHPESTQRPTRELRLGVVCYGGVSLAIYMHGITREVHNLMIASEAFQRDRQRDPFAESDSVLSAYWDALRKAEEDPLGRGRTRVVVDVISGTSAGGINGVFLAKALAHDLPQDKLRELWMDKGDINVLMGGRVRKYFKILGLVGSVLTPGWKTKPPLRGDLMLRWLLDALEGMDRHLVASDNCAEDRATLVPAGQPLDLFVTMTDHRGYQRSIPIDEPVRVLEKRHRHVMRFRYQCDPKTGEAGPDDFRGDSNRALAFAARATSSFPGAFTPVSLAHLERALGDDAPADLEEDLAGRFFREYGLAQADLSDAYFIDGGVLDNYPFGHAVEALASRQPETEVDRRLIYIQPDPRKNLAGTGEKRGKRGEPRWIGTVLGGLSTIPRFEPIVDEAVALRENNQRIRLIDELVASKQADVRAEIEGYIDEFTSNPSQETLKRLRNDVEDLVEGWAGPGYEAYRLARVSDVVNRFAEGVSTIAGFPEGSTHALFVADVLREWAVQRDLLGAHASNEERKILLRKFDLEFTERRVKFVDHAINRMYRDIGNGARPNRGDLDNAKRILSEEATVLRSVIEARDLPAAVQAEVRQVFDAERIYAAALNPDISPAAFARRHLDQLNDIERVLESFLRDRLAALRIKLYQDFRRETEEWDKQKRYQVLVYYLGFPLWDLLLHPLNAFGELGEFDPIEVVRISPEDSTVLEPRGTEAKLKGIGVAHFEAFFKRSHRENDYLWGRLDAIERLIRMVSPHATDDDILRASRAVLDEERPLMREKRTLRKIDDLYSVIDDRGVSPPSPATPRR